MCGKEVGKKQWTGQNKTTRSIQKRATTLRNNISQKEIRKFKKSCIQKTSNNLKRERKLKSSLKFHPKSVYKYKQSQK